MITKPGVEEVNRTHTFWVTLPVFNVWIAQSVYWLGCKLDDGEWDRGSVPSRSKDDFFAAAGRSLGPLRLLSSPYSVGRRGLFLKTRWAVPILPVHAFVAWRLIKHSNNEIRYWICVLYVCFVIRFLSSFVFCWGDSRNSLNSLHLYYVNWYC